MKTHLKHRLYLSRFNNHLVRVNELLRIKETRASLEFFLQFPPDLAFRTPISADYIGTIKDIYLCQY